MEVLVETGVALVFVGVAVIPPGTVRPNNVASKEVAEALAEVLLILTELAELGLLIESSEFCCCWFCVVGRGRGTK